MLRHIGFALTLLFFITPVFANHCPPADKVRSCSGGSCSFQRLAGWDEIVYYTDKNKPFTFQKERIDNTDQGRELSCFYSYYEEDTHRLMPPALLLRTTIN
jgi:hypothetical protein